MSTEQFDRDLDELRTRAYRRGFVAAVEALEREGGIRYEWIAPAHIERLRRWATVDPVSESHNEPPRPEV